MKRINSSGMDLLERSHEISIIWHVDVLPAANDLPASAGPRIELEIINYIYRSCRPMTVLLKQLGFVRLG